jgi:hypothetical protein
MEELMTVEGINERIAKSAIKELKWLKYLLIY